MFITPGMSSFTDASIEDLSGASPQRDGWVASYLLNSIFRGRLDGPANPMLFNFLRRTHAAFREYELARAGTLAYLANPDAVMEYLAAIAHWEVFLQGACKVGLIAGLVCVRAGHGDGAGRAWGGEG